MWIVGSIEFIRPMWDLGLDQGNSKERWKKEISVGKWQVTDIWKCAAMMFLHSLTADRLPSFQLLELLTLSIHRKKGHLPNYLIMNSFTLLCADA
jgi:hypothetical protein